MLPALLLPTLLAAQYGSHAQLNVEHSAVSYDSIIARWKGDALCDSFDNYLSKFITLDTTHYTAAVSTVTDTVCRERLRTLASPIHLPYNDIIRKHIVAYTTTHKTIVRRMLGFADYYFPIIEQELSRQGLPLELKFIAVVESALSPTAVSRSGAVGLWQFMLPTGRQYGLEVSSMVDDRCDPIRSTQAACRYLKDLYAIYHDWALVMASYNYGPGNVNRAIQRSGKNAPTYWDIYPYLPKDTRDYIPAFVALNYLYHYHWDYGITPYQSPLPLATDTVMVSGRMDIKRIAEATNTPAELLQLLNPQYKCEVVPATVKAYPLVLPQTEIARFLAAEPQLLAEAASADSLKQQNAAAIDSAKVVTAPPKSTVTTIKVKKGDTLSTLAHKYGVTVTQLKKWNHLTSSSIRIGQTLKINR